MSNLLEDGLRKISRAGKRAVRRATSESSLRSLRDGVSATRENAEDTARVVAHSTAAKKAAGAARSAAASGPIKQAAFMCGRAGVVGAVADGSVGGYQAYKAMQEGRIDGRQALIHTSSEAGCGFVTSSSGLAGTLAYFYVFGSMGVPAILCGTGAAMGSRYVYDQIVGETLPDPDDEQARADEDDEGIEEIGPRDD